MKQRCYLMLSAVLCLCLTTSCLKDAADWTYSTDDTLADFAFSDVYNVMNGESNGNSTLRACANLTLSGTTFPITVVADFNGSTGCGDGRVRSGTITAVYSGRWNDPGTTVTITTTDYTVNGYRLEGNEVIENMGLVNNIPTYKVTISNGKVTTPTGDVILRNAVKEYKWIAGSSTPSDITDDEWQLTGSATGTTSSGKDYTADITTPIIKAQQCKWIQQGVVEVTPDDGGAVRSIDYGPNVCDAQVEVAYGTWSTTINLN